MARGRLALMMVALAFGVFVVAPRRTPTLISVQRQSLTLVVSGDTQGWILPCGCTANQSGGLLRRGTYLKQEQARQSTIYVDVGGAPGGTALYQRLKFAAILCGERAMDVAMHNVGAAEAALGPARLRELADETGVAFLSTNARGADGQPMGAAYRIVERGGWRVAFVGVLAPKYASNSVGVREPREAILETLTGLEGKFDTLVVLAYLAEPELRQLAAELPEADVVVGGPTGQAIAPQTIGPVLLAAATNKGKFLVQLELQASQSVRAAWDGKIVEMAASWADDPEQKANVKAFHDDLGRRDLPAGDSGFVTADIRDFPATYRVAGNVACKKCHGADCKQWDGSKHALAWKTLTDRSYHVDSYCQQCHTTGFGLPGGFMSAATGVARTSVGCESCHGPSRAHAEKPTVRTAFAARDQCVRCHDVENSPTFDWSKFWPRITHGVKVGTSVTQAGGAP